MERGGDWNETGRKRKEGIAASSLKNGFLKSRQPSNGAFPLAVALSKWHDVRDVASASDVVKKDGSILALNSLPEGKLFLLFFQLGTGRAYYINALFTRR